MAIEKKNKPDEIKKSDEVVETIQEVVETPQEKPEVKTTLKEAPKQDANMEMMMLILKQQSDTIAELKKQMEERGTKEPPRSSIDDMVAALTRSKMEEDGRIVAMDESQLDPDDVLKDEVSFFHHGNWHLILDDSRSGHPVLTPYRQPIEFKHVDTQIKQVGKNKELSSYCQFKTRSKKIKEWLENHSLYNVDFWKTSNEAINADAREIDRINLYIRSFESMPKGEVIRKLQIEEQQGFKWNHEGDLRNAIVSLAKYQAQKDISGEERGNLIRKAQANEDNIFNK